MYILYTALIVPVPILKQLRNGASVICGPTIPSLDGNATETTPSQAGTFFQEEIHAR